MAKGNQGRKPVKGKARSGQAPGARKGGAKGGGKGAARSGSKGPARGGAKGAGKGKAPSKRFFVGKAPKPAQGRGTGGPARSGRAGLKEAALRPSAPRKPRKGAAPSAAAAVAPVAAVAPPRAVVPDEGMLRARAAVAAGADKKAENPVILDVRGLSGVADYFVLLSAESDRQAAAVADAVDARLEGMGAQRLGSEGRAGGGWVLLDFGDVVVHVMSSESRGFYDLEGLWADAPRVAAT